MLDNPKTELKASIQVASEVNQDSPAWGESVVTPHPRASSLRRWGAFSLALVTMREPLTVHQAGTQWAASAVHPDKRKRYLRTAPYLFGVLSI